MDQYFLLSLYILRVHIQIYTHNLYIQPTTCNFVNEHVFCNVRFTLGHHSWTVAPRQPGIDCIDLLPPVSPHYVSRLPVIERY